MRNPENSYGREAIKDRISLIQQEISRLEAIEKRRDYEDELLKKLHMEYEQLQTRMDDQGKMDLNKAA